MTKLEKSIYDRSRREAMGESYLRMRRDFYKENKESINSKRRSPEGRKIRREYEFNKRSSDKSYAIEVVMRNRMRHALRGKSKASTTMELVGCTPAELRSHLSSKWTYGMSWENYGSGVGKWVVDHIAPCSSFDLSDTGQQQKCFHFENLQPLWWEDNLQKSDRLMEAA